jgi:hypothetical protein
MSGHWVSRCELFDVRAFDARERAYRGVQENTDGQMRPVYKVRAWRVPNEDGMARPVDSATAIWLGDGSKRFDGFRPFYAAQARRDREVIERIRWEA